MFVRWHGRPGGTGRQHALAAPRAHPCIERPSRSLAIVLELPQARAAFVCRAALLGLAATRRQPRQTFGSRIYPVAPILDRRSEGAVFTLQPPPPSAAAARGASYVTMQASPSSRLPTCRPAQSIYSADISSHQPCGRWCAAWRPVLQAPLPWSHSPSQFRWSWHGSSMMHTCSCSSSCCQAA